MRQDAMVLGLLVACLVAGILPATAAQTAATASATILSASAVSGLRALEFGSIAPAAAGTVTVSPQGLRTASAGLRLLDTESGDCAARFKVEGAAGSSFSVELPTSVSLHLAEGGMTVTNFLAAPSAAVDGEMVIGATLSLPAHQPPGLYTGSFAVIVSYE